MVGGYSSDPATSTAGVTLNLSLLNSEEDATTLFDRIRASFDDTAPSLTAIDLAGVADDAIGFAQEDPSDSGNPSAVAYLRSGRLVAAIMILPPPEPQPLLADRTRQLAIEVAARINPAEETPTTPDTGSINTGTLNAAALQTPDAGQARHMVLAMQPAIRMNGETAGMNG